VSGGQTGGPAASQEEIADLEARLAELRSQPSAAEQARQDKRDRYARQREQAEAAETADFDAYRALQAPTTLGVKIRGRVFHLPKQAPLSFTLETERQKSGSGRMTTEDLRRMVTMLFGPQALDHIVESGYDHDDLGILIMYASANLGSPVERVSFAEAERFYRENEERLRSGKAPAGPRPGEAPNRAARRRGKRKRGGQSSATGR
jgi:hypothetical protein